jgi:hypothetical protein
MSKLNYIIPPQGFEVVRDLIAAILKTEFDQQEVLDSDPSAHPIVFTSRFVPIDKVEIPSINVRLSRGNPDTNTTRSGDGTYKFLIDVYAKAKSTAVGKADEIAEQRLHKMMGRVMVILEDPQYRTLGITAKPAGIGGTEFDDMAIGDPNEIKEGINAVMGRLTFSVRISDSAVLLTANPIDDYDGQAQIGTTGKGHQISSDPT